MGEMQDARYWDFIPLFHTNHQGNKMVLSFKWPKPLNMGPSYTALLTGDGFERGLHFLKTLTSK